MKAPESTPPAIVCEILAAPKDRAATLAEIATACARDVGQPLTVKTSASPSPTPRSTRTAPESVLTLHLPAALAATQNQVWCLACRLACFCPGARVSVLIQGESAFAPAAPAKRHRHHRAA
jgi:hypothetical protein